jgi:hypothetical protein
MVKITMAIIVSKVALATQNKVAMIECGKYSTRGEILFRIVKYWKRIMRMGDNEFVSICYSLQVRNNKNKMNWAALLKHVLNSIDLGCFCILEVMNETSILNIARQRCNVVEMQNMFKNINW